MMNTVQIIGRLTKDVDLRYTQNGVAVASFTVAVERRFKNAQGEKETDFILCTMWRKAAENFTKFTHKGSLVGIEGSIQTRNYENKEGQRVYVTEVQADNFSLLEPKNSRQDNSNSSAGVNDSGYSENASQGVNFENQTTTDPFSNSQNGNFSNNTTTTTITDNDLPF